MLGTVVANQREGCHWLNHRLRCVGRRLRAAVSHRRVLRGMHGKDEGNQRKTHFFFPSGCNLNDAVRALPDYTRCRVLFRE
jgi:hypothetical protein